MRKIQIYTICKKRKKKNEKYKKNKGNALWCNYTKVFGAKNKYNNLHTAKIIELKKITVGMYLKRKEKKGIKRLRE